MFHNILEVTHSQSISPRVPILRLVLINMFNKDHIRHCLLYFFKLYICEMYGERTVEGKHMSFGMENSAKEKKSCKDKPQSRWSSKFFGKDLEDSILNDKLNWWMKKIAERFSVHRTKAERLMHEFGFIKKLDTWTVGKESNVHINYSLLFIIASQNWVFLCKIDQ